MVWSLSRRDEAAGAGVAEVLVRRRSGGVVVFVDESTEDPSPADLVDGDRFGLFVSRTREWVEVGRSVGGRAIAADVVAR